MPQVALVGTGYQVDLISLTVTIKWDLVGCGKYLLRTYPPVQGVYANRGCDCVNRPVDIYFNGWVLIQCRPHKHPLTTNSASKPIFSYDPANFPVEPTLARSA